jgi:hypothetical protein
MNLSIHAKQHLDDEYRSIWTMSSVAEARMLEAAGKLFPQFASAARRRDLENVLPPATVDEVAALEQELGLALPESYKSLLRCARGFWLM